MKTKISGETDLAITLARRRQLLLLQPKVHVDPVVEAETRGRHLAIRVDRGAAVEQHLRVVCTAIAVVVPQEENARVRRHHHPALHHHDALRVVEVVGEQRAAIHPAVTVDVLEQPDARTGFELLVAVVAIAFDDVQPSTFVERDIHRVRDQRLRGDQFDAQPGIEPESLQRVFGREWTRLNFRFTGKARGSQLGSESGHREQDDRARDAADLRDEPPRGVGRRGAKGRGVHHRAEGRRWCSGKSTKPAGRSPRPRRLRSPISRRPLSASRLSRATISGLAAATSFSSAGSSTTW